jgi:hypothetical protein
MENGKKEMKGKAPQCVLVVFWFVLTATSLNVSPNDVLFGKSEMLGAWLSRWRDDETQKFRVHNFSQKVFEHMYWAVQDYEYIIPEKYYSSVLKCADYFGIYLPGHHVVQWDGSPRDLAVGEKIELRGTFQLQCKGDPIADIAGWVKIEGKVDREYISSFSSTEERDNPFGEVQKIPYWHFILKSNVSIAITADRPMMVMPYSPKSATTYRTKREVEVIVVEPGKVFHIQEVLFANSLMFNFEGGKQQKFHNAVMKDGPISRYGSNSCYISSEKIFFTSGDAYITIFEK